MQGRVVCLARTMRALERTHEIHDPRVLIDTFPWWKRLLSRCLWKTPIRRVLARRWLNPYASVVAIVKPREDGPQDDSTSGIPKTERPSSDSKTSRDGGADREGDRRSENSDDELD